MIPRLSRRGSEPSPSRGFFETLRRLGFAGDIEASEAVRTVYATDNSIYQVEPSGVIFPKGVSDLKLIGKLLCAEAFVDVVVAARGGGTGTNGQALTSGVSVDLSRHMNRILEIDPIRRVARVEAGVVKDQLNKALKPHGLFFAPELSTSNRATIGGMISTDACGQGSCLYGKTSNHVLGLHVVFADGSDWWSRPLDRDALEDCKKRPDRVGTVCRTVEAIATDKRTEIAEIFPKLNRYMTGYDLAHVRRKDGSFDLNAVICGSEGTLAFIAEAEVNLLPIPNCAALINVRYGDFNAALEDARDLVSLGVASVETIDERVLQLARNDAIWAAIDPFFPIDSAGSPNGINIVEILADSDDELTTKIEAVQSKLDSADNTRRKGYTVARRSGEIEAIWAMRKRAVGLLGNVEGPIRPVPFVEDTAVPPDNLAAYIREFRALLDKEGVTYGMFGHVDAGVLHVRPALDLTRPDHERLIRRVSDAVVDLTRKYGGVLWGEHGKGVRSEYVPAFFGPLYPSLQDIKRAFDPGNRLNPGKIAVPDAQPLLKIDEVPLRGQLDRMIADDVRLGFDNAAFCNGNGACFDFDQSNLMCPSFKATGDRRFSPKGRASLMREWLRLLAEQRIDPTREAERLRRKGSVGHLLWRAANTLDPRNRRDFSHEVREAMETCLSCKACTGQCPVRVNVPAFRARFLELYYGRYLRPVRDGVISMIEQTLPVAARFPFFYNLIAGKGLGRTLMRGVGLTALPAMPRFNLPSELRRRGVGVAMPESIAAMAVKDRARAVVFVPDVFTATFEPELVLAAVDIARKLDLIPFIAPRHVNGKALHVHGRLGSFERTVKRTSKILEHLNALGVSLVGIDPSMTLAFRSEYKAIAGVEVNVNVLLPQEWLAEELARPESLAMARVAEKRRFVIAGHCTERANAAGSFDKWTNVFEALGIRVSLASTGCCGMAGTFGHEVRNREISEKLYSMSWSSLVADTRADEVVMATGYSCRSQVSKMDGLKLPHPLEVIAVCLADGRSSVDAVR